MELTTQMRNRIVDITLGYTDITRADFFLLKNKKKYARIRNVCIALMMKKGVHYSDIATTFKMSFQNVYYQMAQCAKWGDNPFKYDFELNLLSELETEYHNKESELSLY
jgi:hypothetical protein